MSDQAHSARRSTQWSNDDLSAAVLATKRPSELVQSLADVKQLTQLLEALGTGSEHATSILDGTAAGVAHFVETLRTANPMGLNRPMVVTMTDQRQAAYTQAVDAIRLARRHARTLHAKLLDAAVALTAAHADHDQATRRMRRDTSR
ncbi:hypothetical protein FXN61_42005 [Lentzea sp. PSKA42]|uniref:PE family protein n=1 Tax=Lentzea indica TaxID=2604800 RepID=A0ABX1FV79_9PSEU|nr:hypothetical protein [Lentzea indica]NKE62949.1 hypothetical protein [Lentzea indica]